MKQTIQLTTLSAINIGLAFLFQWYIITQLGAGIKTDALFAGMTIPQLVLAIISGSLMHVLVPLLSDEKEDHFRHNAWGFLVIVGGIIGLLAVLLYLTAPWWVPLIVPGFKETSLALTVKLTRIQLIGMVFTATNGVQWAAYHARRQFLWAESAPIIAGTVALLLLIWLLPHFGVIAAAWLITIKVALQTLMLLPGMGRPVRFNLNNTIIQQAWMRIKPLLLGTAFYKTDPLVDRFLLSTATSGSLSLYYLAQQLYGVANQIINTAVAAPLVPLLSKFHKDGDRDRFKQAYLRKLLRVGAFSLTGLFIFLLFGESILDLLIGYGNINADNVKQLWLIMLCLSGMFIGGAMGLISSSSFYALGDTKTPTRFGIYSYTFYIPIKIAIFYYFGIPGLAICTSMFLIVNLFLQTSYLNRKYIK